ncbi:hypothetical protein [Modestobacter sp. SYSU DS0511]
MSTARDPRISEIFYYFEKHTSIETGRTVGRKIGVMQEIILLKYLQASPLTSRGLYLERMLTGASGTGHKVEFAWYAREPQGFLRAGDPLPGVPSATVVKVEEPLGRVTVRYGDTRAGIAIGGPPPANSRLRQDLAAEGLDLRVQSISGDVCEIDLIDHNNLLAALESKRVGAQRFKGSDKLGSGIQTIEKAKQASLVAIDLSRRYNAGYAGAGEGQRQFISLVALGNGIHWTEKDRQIFREYVDSTWTVTDEAIIRYFEYVDTLRTEGSDQITFFSNYFAGMTKFAGDGFEVGDADFVPIAEEDGTLADVISSHLARVNPL